MQSDCSLSDKILTEIEGIINNDEELKEFTVVPILENERNKSPVLYQEHNLGLEMWCVKHVYQYCHSYIFKVRNDLKRNRLSQPQVQKLNKLLMGAVLLQPNVSTYWNMRRELIENDSIKSDKELLLTKLILTHKSKSNEAFSHRRWIINRGIKAAVYDPIHFILPSVGEELAVAEIAAKKAQNNYHAWTYRIWLVENVPHVSVSNELRFSSQWISYNISDHSGLHYRQYLLSRLDRVSETRFSKCSNFVRDRFRIVDASKHSVLRSLFGRKPPKNRRANLELTVCILLYELLYVIEDLNRSFPAHESIWYHRRFVVYELLKVTYEYFETGWQRTVAFDDSKVGDVGNIVDGTVREIVADGRKENGEKYPKQFKSELTPVESCLLYKTIAKTEGDFVKSNGSSANDAVQVNLARRHGRWLKCVLGVSCAE